MIDSCADAGTWTRADAREWWQANTSGLSTIVNAEDDARMSRTEPPIDLDSRILRRGGGALVLAKESPASQLGSGWFDCRYCRTANRYCN